MLELLAKGVYYWKGGAHEPGFDAFLISAMMVSMDLTRLKQAPCRARFVIYFISRGCAAVENQLGMLVIQRSISYHRCRSAGNFLRGEDSESCNIEGGRMLFQLSMLQDPRRRYAQAICLPILMIP